MTQVNIVSRWDSSRVLFTFEATEEQQASGLAIRAALEAAVEVRANLSGANLSDANLSDAGPMVRAGCFWRSLDDFAFAVKERHDRNEHAQEYEAAIALFRAHVRLWTPAVAVKAAEPVAA